MPVITADPQYGDKTALAQAGLRTKESPITGTTRQVLPTGRPSGGGTAPALPEPPGPDAASVQLMHNYAEAQSALNRAQQVASLPDAGPWAQWLLQLAQQQRDEAGLALNNSTPNFYLTGE